MKYYKVVAILVDISGASAPHAYGTVLLTFEVQGKSLIDAMANANKALKECSKLAGEITTVELI